MQLLLLLRKTLLQLFVLLLFGSILSFVRLLSLPLMGFFDPGGLGSCSFLSSTFGVSFHFFQFSLCSFSLSNELLSSSLKFCLMFLSHLSFNFFPFLLQLFFAFPLLFFQISPKLGHFD